jgi:type II secretion system protein N
MLAITPERLRAVRRWLLQSAFGVLVFGIALYFCFPYDRAKDLAIAWAANQGYDVTIGSAGPGFGFAVNFKDIHVRSRPTGTGKPIRFTLDSARVRVSPLAMLTNATSLGIGASGLGGDVGIDLFNQKKGPMRVAIKAHAIDLAELPGVRETINLPLTGTFEMSLDVSSKTGRYSDADGSLSFKCKNCVLGDGKTPLKVEGNPLLSGGLTLPRVRLGDLVGRVSIEKGTARLQGVEAKSPDGDLALEGEIQLHDPLPTSTLALYLRFRLSEPFLKSADKLQLMLQMAGSAGKRPDGFYGVRLSGRLGAMSPPVFTPISPSGINGPGPGIRAGVHSALGGFARPSVASAVPPPPPPPPTMNATVEAPPPAPAPPPPPIIAQPPPPPPPPPPPAAEAAPPAPPPSEAAPVRGAPPGPEDNPAPPPPPGPEGEPN